MFKKNTKHEQKTNDHRLKVRGIFKAHLFLVSAAIGINFGRIYRYLSATLPEKWVFRENSCIIISERIRLIKYFSSTMKG